MRFMLLMIPKGYENAAPGAMPDAKAVEAMMQYNESLQQAGVLLSLEGLHPPSMGARVTFNGSEPKITEGAASNGKEVLGGYWMIQVNSKEEAIEWASRCPAASNETIEVRQVQEFEDFPEDVQQAAAEFTESFSDSTTINPSTPHEAEIRQLIADQQRAISSKDLEKIMSLYAADSVIFDVKPPLQTKGKQAIRQLWEESLPCLPDSFDMEIQDLTITANENLATAHWLFHFTGEPDHPATQMWMRVTTICQKNQGTWQVLHEHISAPLNPANA